MVKWKISQFYFIQKKCYFNYYWTCVWNLC